MPTTRPNDACGEPRLTRTSAFATLVVFPSTAVLSTVFFATVLLATVLLATVLLAAPRLGAQAKVPGPAGSAATGASEKADGTKGDSAKGDTDAQRLERLLAQLRKLKPEAWQAHLQQLEATAADHDQKLRALHTQVDAEAKRAAEAHAAVDRCKAVMALLSRPAPAPAAMVPVPDAKAPAARAPAAKAAGAKAPGIKAPDAKAPAAKAPDAKAPDAKAPAAKAPAAKPPDAKKATTPAPMMSITGTPAAKSKDAKAPAGSAAPAGGFVTYDDNVQPIFMQHCSACHDSADRKGGLDLTSFATARAGGASGTTIVPGDIDQSRLYQLVAHLQKPTMPPDEERIDGKLVDAIRRWILAGAPENAAEARALAARGKDATAKVATPPLQTGFDAPAPMPANWPAVAPTKVLAPVHVTALAACARSPLLAIPGMRQVFVVDTTAAEARLLGILPFGHGDVEVLRFSADGSRLLVGGGTPGKTGRAVLYDVATGNAGPEFGKEFDTVLAAAVHPRLSHVALGGSSRRVRVFDTASGKLAYELKDHDEWILAVDFSNDGKYLASCDRAGAVVLTEASSGRNVEVIRRHQGAAYRTRFTPDSRALVSVGADATVRMFRVPSADQAWQRPTGSPAMSLAVSPDGAQIAAGCEDGRVRLFRANGAPIATLEPVGDWIYALAFDKDARRLFVGDFRGTVTVFDLDKRRVAARLRPSAPTGDAREARKPGVVPPANPPQ